MSIISPTIQQTIASTVDPLASGALPWEAGGGVAPPVNLTAPVLAGDSYAGGSPAITAGTWTGAPALTYSLEVNGVEVVAGSEATVEAYVYTFAAALAAHNAILYEIPNGNAAQRVASNTVAVVGIPSSNLVAWFEAGAALNTLDANGDPETLYDNAGAGNHADAIGGVGDRPAIAASAEFGNQIVATCDGTAGEAWRINPFVGGTIAQPTTMYWLGKQTDSGTRIVIDGGSASNRQLITKLADPNGFAAQALTSLNSLNTTDLPVAICATFNGVSSAIYTDDMGTADATGNTGANGLGGLTISGSGTGTIYASTFAFAAVYSELHTQTQREAVITYLIAKFGVGTAP